MKTATNPLWTMFPCFTWSGRRVCSRNPAKVTCDCWDRDGVALGKFFFFECPVLFLVNPALGFWTPNIRAVRHHGAEGCLTIHKHVIPESVGKLNLLACNNAKQGVSSKNHSAAEKTRTQVECVIPPPSMHRARLGACKFLICNCFCACGILLHLGVVLGKPRRNGVPSWVLVFLFLEGQGHWRDTGRGDEVIV